MLNQTEESIKVFINQTEFTENPRADLIPFIAENCQQVIHFHQSMPVYQPTPLLSLTHLAHHLGLGALYVKDEAKRFGLNAFKALGASYAMAQYIAEQLGEPLSSLSYCTLVSDETRQRLPELTFATTTDGNHGRGVAWVARQLKQQSVIYMPKGSSLQRLEAIRAEGATAEIVDMNYDEAVRMTATLAQQHNWVVVQDTAWPGYQKIPLWIMQGYSSLMLETFAQLGSLIPTHVFVQAGVGSFAGMVQGVLTAHYGRDAPKVIVVEAAIADCLYRSAKAQTGQSIAVGGDLQTIMAGLACGEANMTGWQLLRDYASAFVSCPDEVTEYGMRILAHPLGNDTKIISGESGAVTTGLVALLMQSPQFASLRAQLGLDSTARVLVINSEGDTDPVHYQEVIRRKPRLSLAEGQV